MIGNHKARIKPDEPTKQPRERKWLLPIIIVVAVLVLAGIGWAIYQSLRTASDNDTVVVRSDACKQEHIERFNALIDPLDLAKFHQLEVDIKRLDNYEGSANCMYMLTRYELASGTATGAKARYLALKRLAPDEYLLSSSFSSRASASYESLELAVAAMEERERMLENQYENYGQYEN